jgi:hypothetical protein
MKVKAAEGLLVPKEIDPRTYYGTEPEEADATPYVIRRLAAGELLDAEDEPPVVTPATEAGKTKLAKA